MSVTLSPDQLQRCWTACWHRARRPVEGVRVSEEMAGEIAERTIRNVALDYETFPGEAEFTARALEETAAASRGWVARARRQQADPQAFHDPEDRRYERNLNLDRLQKHDPQRGFHDSEWNQLPPLLRPLALATLARKGIKGADAEDVFSDSLAELVRERAGSGHSPILDPTVFEEIIPLHTRIVSFRSVDWYRRRGALKNQPNTGESLDALASDPEHAVQFEDRSADPQAATFERIFKECREALEPAEWELVFTLYVAQSASIKDLIDDEAFCARFGIKPQASISTRRRVLTERVETALEKLRNSLRN